MSQKPETGNQKPEARNQKPEIGNQKDEYRAFSVRILFSEF
jgi:hypothetical protein